MKHTAIGVAVLALLLGGVGGYAIGNSSTDDTSTDNNNSNLVENGTTTSPAAGLRVALNNALREHVNLGGVALRNIFTNSPDADASVAALDNNSVEVASLVGSVYGEQAEEDFLELWRQHIVFFANYTTGARDGDMDAMEQALEDLSGYGEAASNFFEAANPNLPKSAVKPLLGEHRSLIIDTIDLIGAGDFDAAYVKLGEAADQVGTIADALADGIEKQNPEQF
jgi:hypothetical protein